MPVASLNPYMNRWTLKAKVAVKNDIVSWSNARGDGTLFKVTLADADGEEIEAVFFKEACAKYHAALVEGGVYYFSGGKVKPSNPRYSATKCGYEVTFDMASKIEACADASGIGPCGNQFFNPTSMCAYVKASTRALRLCFENSTRAIDSSKNQPYRLRFDRD